MNDTCNYMLDGRGGLNFIINDLEYFNTDIDYNEQFVKFDKIMTDLYDFADYNCVWINV